MIVFGHRLYGRVDRLSNGWYVATQFAHLDYVPLFPMATWLVTSQKGRGWTGVKLPFSFRSVAMTYARAVAVAAAIGGVGFAVIAAVDRHATIASATLGVVIGLVSIAVVIGAHLAWRRASAEREAWLWTFIEAQQISGKLPPARGFDVMPQSPTDAAPPAMPIAMPVDAAGTTRGPTA